MKMNGQEKEENIPDTQEIATQSQNQTWMNIESQPIENIVWGRLYPKSIKIKSLGTMSIRPKYVIINSTNSFDLHHEHFSVGRLLKNNLCLTNEELPEKVLPRISKFHFTIKRELNNLNQCLNPVYIQDFSRHGTFVNGEKVGMNNVRILRNNDTISVVYPLFKIFVFKDLYVNDVGELPPEIISKYYVSRKLGSGACGVVRLVFDIRTCQKYAMKHVQKNLLAEGTKLNILNDPVRVINEANIMKSLQHPCIIKMHDIVDKPESVFMILEYMNGGDLLNRIVSKQRLSENISRFYFYQMCHAVKYLHDKGITHRDLKPDNILLETNDEETLLKISDFGLSKFVRKDSLMRTLCGTPLYVAPEVLKTGGISSYTRKVDIWSLGVVLFTCLSGTLPFSDDYGSPATEQIKRGKFTFGHPSWRSVSSIAKSLIYEMLTVDPRQRPSIDRILKHKWFLEDKITIEKVHKLMNIPTPSYMNSDDENFLEPPLKRARR